jgi:hypothetical protein
MDLENSLATAAALLLIDSLKSTTKPLPAADTLPLIPISANRRDRQGNIGRARKSRADKIGSILLYRRCQVGCSCAVKPEEPETSTGQTEFMTAFQRRKHPWTWWLGHFAMKITLLVVLVILVIWYVVHESDLQPHDLPTLFQKMQEMMAH